MNERLRAALAAALYVSGVVPVARWWQRRSAPTVTILNYHRATPGNLRQHLLYLRRHYRILPLERALEELAGDPADPARNQRARRHAPMLVLTFDDGYHDNYTVAATLAQELRVPITIFLASGYMRSGDPFWWTECERLVRGASDDTITIGGQVYRCGGRRERRALLRALVDRFERAETLAERDGLLRDVQAALAVSACQCPPDPLARPLTWAEVHAMERSGWVTFGAHTQRHPVLGYLTDVEELTHEVAGCKADMEEQLGHPVRAFAYPVGKGKDIGNRAPSIVRATGFTWALTTIAGTNTVQTDPHLLCRIYTDPGQHWLVVAAEAAGVYSFCVRLARIPSALLTRARAGRAASPRPAVPCRT